MICFLVGLFFYFSIEGLFLTGKTRKKIPVRPDSSGGNLFHQTQPSILFPGAVRSRKNKPL